MHIGPASLTRTDAKFVYTRIGQVLSAVLIFVTIVMLSPITSVAQEYMDCGSLEASYGPFDYTNPTHVRNKLPIVEKGHFTRDVENLILGSSTANPMGDISYTLRTFPNHHRALYAMSRYMLRLDNRPIAGVRNSPECWFDRAMRFNPTDGTVRIIYGLYLHRIDSYDKSLERYTEALVLIPNSAELHYNLGLLYFDMGDYESSKKHAEVAYGLGFPLPALKRKLQEIG